MTSVRRAERGDSLVEFALTAVIFFTLVFFVLDGGRILWSYISVSNAAVGAARELSFRGADSKAPLGPAKQTVKCSAGSANKLCQLIAARATGLDMSKIAAEATWSPSNKPGGKVTIRVTYTVSSVTSLVWASTTFILTRQATRTIQN